MDCKHSDCGKLCWLLNAVRFYRIEITDETGAIVKFGDSLMSFSSHNDFGIFKPGALGIEFDLPVFAADVPAGDGLVKIYGLPLEILNQASVLNLKNIRIEAGMMPGFPLASEQAKAMPARRGVIFEGSIKQAFGTWQGTEQSLDLIVTVQLTSKPKEAPKETRTLLFNCKAGQSFQDAISQAVSAAGIAANIKIDSRLVASEPIIFHNDNMQAFALTLKRQSRQIVKDASYPGLFTIRRVGGYDFVDNSAQSAAIPVKFNDLIGQPVWHDLIQAQMKLVMRADIIVGSTIQMPEEYIAINKSRILGSAKEQITFVGTAFVNQVRHVGNSRQPDANSWVTIIDVILNSSPASNTAIHQLTH